MNGDLIRREDLIKKIFPYGMPDGGNYGINARAVMEAVMGVAAVDAEPVVHAHWEDVYGGKYANPRYRCSRCKRKAMCRMEQDVLLSWKEVQELTPRCSYCGAHMDEEVSECE